MGKKIWLSMHPRNFGFEEIVCTTYVYPFHVSWGEILPLAATKVKMSDSEKKVNRNTYNISSIKRVTRKFLEVLHYSLAKHRQRNVQKSVPYVLSCFVFLLIRPTFFGCL